MAASTKGGAEGIVLLVTGASTEIILLKALIEGGWAAFFGVLGASPVPAIIRKLCTNRLITDPEESKSRTIPAS